MNTLNLGLIGNCQVGVLVDQLGRFVWGCFPRVDSDPAFCSLLAGNGETETGFFDVELLDLDRSEQAYDGNTAILSTTLYDKSGGSVCIDDFAPRYEQFGRTFRPIMVIRRITPLSGSPTVRIRLRPAAGYGGNRAEVTYGSNHIRYVDSRFTLRLTTNASLASVLEERAIVLEEPVSLILGADETIPEHPDKIGQEMLDETRRYWQRWVRGLSLPFEWQDEVIRAAITLKLCTYEDTGAVLAALTTSIPEAAAQRPQLGLSFLLVAGQLLRGQGAQQARRHQDHGGVSRLSEQHRRRVGQPGAASAGLRRVRAGPAGGTNRRDASRVSRLWARFASATRPIARFRTTFTGPSCWLPPSNSSIAGFRARAGARNSSGWKRSAAAPSSCSISPMRAFGSTGAGRKCIPIRASCAGPHVTGWDVSPDI